MCPNNFLSLEILVGFNNQESCREIFILELQNKSQLLFSGKGREEIETSDIEDDLSSYVSNLSYQQNIDKESLGEGSRLLFELK